MNLEDMTKEELTAYIKEINGLLGAVDGDTIGSLKKFIRIYNIISWQVEKYYMIICFLIDKIDNIEDRQFIIDEISKVREEVRKEVIK